MAILDHLNQVLGDHTTAIARDLKLNLKRIFEDSSLSNEEALLALVALAKSANASPLLHAAREELIAMGIGPDQVREAEESAAIMAMLNTYYRFRHFVDETQEEDGYGPAKLRMQSLANPNLGKEKFEMLSFAVSILNGCEKCVNSHQAALQHLGVTRDKLHDLARLASVVKGVQSLVA